MTTKDDGGPAYPFSQGMGGPGTWAYGMSLRDWFAGMALAGIQASVSIKDGVETVYEIADAMIEERKK